METNQVHENLVNAGNVLPANASLLNLLRDPNKTSEKYVSSDDITLVNSLNARGWSIFDYKQVRAQDQSRQQFKSYIASYHNPSLPSLGEEGKLTLLQRNAKDGSKSLEFMIGFYRAVCANGLIVGSSAIPTIKVRHTKALPEQVEGITKLVFDKLPEVQDRILTMKGIHLTEAQAKQFASAAVQLRFPDDPNSLKVEDVLRANRNADQDSSLWTTFNRCQENLIKPVGLVKTTQDNKNRKITGVKNIELYTKINQGLWSLAETYIN